MKTLATKERIDMDILNLYIYTHKFNKYPTFYAVAPDRNIANALLTLWAHDLSSYDGRNCDFNCQIMTQCDNFDWAPSEGSDDLITRAIELQNKF